MLRCSYLDVICLVQCATNEIKTFSLHGIKDTPPYMHGGRLLTLDDTVEYFNLVSGLKLTDQEKKDLVAFMCAL